MLSGHPTGEARDQVVVVVRGFATRAACRFVLAIAAASLFAAPAIAKPAAADASPHAATQAWRFPLKKRSTWGYRISQRYGDHGHVDRGRYHTGTDVAAPCGTPVVAVSNARVVQVRRKASGGYGKIVVLEHNHVAHGTVYALYAHLREVGVEPGQVVERGQRLGTSGTTGRSTGCHLHFAMRTKPGTGSGYTKSHPRKHGWLDPAAVIKRTLR